ncbi:sigma-70 family RNA polymerase sigma factor [Aeoliella sp. SH292]|uniref:sigma-70 family RNA polymerase sigma factor n=1 Tax=Aeoliella sp. SH292 TaxID=3454464 RepID=UPI003F94B324
MAQNPMQPKPKPVELSDPADWVDRYGDALLRFAGGRVASRELAEDLVQETFLAAFRHRSQFDGKSTFGTWLVAILRRKIADHHRKSGRSPDLDAESLAAAHDPFTAKGKWTSSCTKWRTTPKDLAENAEFWIVFQGCLSGLPMHLAQAFQMRELALETVEVASKKIGVTPKNLAVRLHRARLLLRQCLESKWFHHEPGGTS